MRNTIYDSIVSKTASDDLDIDVARLGYPVVLESILFIPSATTSLELRVFLVRNATSFPLISPDDDLNAKGDRKEYGIKIIEGDIIRITVPSGDDGKTIHVWCNISTDNVE